MKNKTEGTLWAFTTPLTETSPTSSNGRARVSLRVSAEGSKLGFSGTNLGNGWVTVEASEELPHANTERAQKGAFLQAVKAARWGIDLGLEMTLASLVLSEDDSRLLEHIIGNSDARNTLSKSGVEEVWVRALAAAPLRVWQSLSEQEQDKLRGLFR